VNTSAAAALVREVMRALQPQPSDQVLELYSGVGLFTLPIAAAAARVLAVEMNPRAVADARRNLAAHGLAHKARVVAAEAGAMLQRETARWSAVAVDPPRTGLERRVLDAIARLRPERLVYVSCDPATLARDAQRLVAAGYRLDYAQPLDLFPQTHHVEIVSRFVRQV